MSDNCLLASNGGFNDLLANIHEKCMSKFQYSTYYEDMLKLVASSAQIEV